MACFSTPDPPLRAAAHAQRSLRTVAVLVALATAHVAVADAQTSTFPIAASGTYPTVAAMDDGGFVVVWDDSYAHRSIRGRRFDAARQPAGPAFHVGYPGWEYLDGLHVAADHTGFTVVWESSWFLFEEPTPTNVAAAVRRFDRDGAPRHRQMFLAQGSRNYLEPSVGVLPDGRSLVTWKRSPVRTAPTIFARWLARDGEPLGSRFRLLTPRRDAANVWVQAIRALRAGGLAVAWDDRVAGPPESYRSHLQCLDESGATVGHAPNPPGAVTLLARPSGGFLAVWVEPALAPSGRAQLMAGDYDERCQPLGRERHLGAALAPAVWIDASMDATGNLLVIASPAVTGDTRTVGYLFDRQLRPVGGELAIAPMRFAEGATAAVAGGFIVAWTGKTSWPPGNLMGTFVPSPAESP